MAAKMKQAVAIIEDNADSREMLRILLEQFFEIIIFPTATEALDRIVVEKPAVVLCDLIMPDLSGLDFVSKLRAQGISVPVIAVTAHVVREVREKVLAAGFDAFVPKPIMDMDGLVQLIRC